MAFCVTADVIQQRIVFAESETQKWR